MYKNCKRIHVSFCIGIISYVLIGDMSQETDEGNKTEDTEKKTDINDILHSINSLKQNEIHKIAIANIYDPSKFWLTVHIKEKKLFENYLTYYYKDKKILMPNYHIKTYVTCIVSRNSIYYRATILPALLYEENKIRVFLIDYGQTVNVKREEVFYIFKKHRSVPRFAIRAALAGITPLNHKEPWTKADLGVFLMLTYNKQLLAKIIEIDQLEKIVHVVLLTEENSRIVSINDNMIQMGVASFGKWIYNSNQGISKYKRKLQYMHLLPTFNALEKGTVPSSLWEQNILKDVPLDILYKPYYEYQNVNSHIQASVQ